MRLMRKRVCEHDVAYWARSFLDTLAHAQDHGLVAVP
jgi:trehalose-6-phosphate synthase